MMRKLGVVVAKFALSVVLFVLGAVIVREVSLALGSRYSSSGLGLAMAASLIPPVWSYAPIPWRIAAGAAAFIAGIFTYMIGRSFIQLYHAGVITDIHFSAHLVGVFAVSSWFVSLVIVFLVLRWGRSC